MKGKEKENQTRIPKRAAIEEERDGWRWQFFTKLLKTYLSYIILLIHSHRHFISEKIITRNCVQFRNYKDFLTRFLFSFFGETNSSGPLIIGQKYFLG